MNLLDIVNRAPSPEPWSEGDNIPWDDPEFSARMLKEHLSQTHDLASRRPERIDRQVAWIHAHVLAERPARVLDLACGPGLYAARLAKLGHTVAGIDFSPASIDYATARCGAEELDCVFHHADLRKAEFGEGFDLAMMIFGQFNVFRPAEARGILKKACAALAPGGRLLLETQTDESVESRGRRAPTWHSAESSLFSPKPYLCLEEAAWDGASRAMTERYYVVDAADGRVTRYALTTQAYTTDELTALLAAEGFTQVEFIPTLGEPAPDADFIGVLARKGACG